LALSHAWLGDLPTFHGRGPGPHPPDPGRGP